MRDQRITLLEEGLSRHFRRLLPAGSRVVLAVSGGADSMALLSASAAITQRLAMRFEVATVDHGARAESAIEAAEVGRVATGLGLAHHVLRVELGTTAGFEAAAREARYRELERLRERLGFDAIATAHTANDQAETLLMRLMRGAALGGAGGIQELRADKVVRPLLFATREDVLAYLEAKQLQFARDPMNADPSFFRVRVRQHVVPALDAAAGAPTVKTLARFAALASEDDAWLQARADEARGGATELEAVAILALPLPIARRVVAGALADAGVEVDFDVVADVLRALRDEGTATLGGDRLFACKNGRGSVVTAPARLRTTSSGTGGREGV
ncbi:MAG: tRNA lysidine(34) synthetase TilS [Archangium sp.]